MTGLPTWRRSRSTRLQTVLAHRGGGNGGGADGGGGQRVAAPDYRLPGRGSHGGEVNGNGWPGRLRRDG